VKRFGECECAEINHADRVALTIGNISVLAECRAVVRDELLAKVPPSEAAKDGQEDGDEKELAQSGRRGSGTERLAERATR